MTNSVDAVILVGGSESDLNALTLAGGGSIRIIPRGDLSDLGGARFVIVRLPHEAAAIEELTRGARTRVERGLPLVALSDVDIDPRPLLDAGFNSVVSGLSEAHIWAALVTYWVTVNESL